MLTTVMIILSFGWVLNSGSLMLAWEPLELEGLFSDNDRLTVFLLFGLVPYAMAALLFGAWLGHKKL